MNHMTVDSEFAPWWDKDPVPPMCPKCKSFDIRLLLDCGVCNDCGHFDYEHKFTER